ncbi:RNA polymerase sigma factor (sigma-70 family) [Actinomycetospora succinea]|uniref:RNA polymerase sigma factor (Sigma-70 family) n=1 Tax=Actinomycetospora succinea TaxID=663603 RepID=A0A4V3DB36_9PSEU|nr:sigma-70 family RNA polymerase sigma factor [Actinomycetospora succinea]TDQ64968.1 RNA polymerase sigma factor (sigma-70 family) [Actinomycetospora succinea]
MDDADDGRGADGDPRSDAELIARLRGRGADQDSTAAFATLYARHQHAARWLARQLARSSADADDLVAGAFTRLLEVLRAGRGPTEAFRAYLLTSVRHLAYDRSRAERRLDLTDDITDVHGIDPDGTVVPFTDPALAGLERTMAARAFATLPERWQAVLWHLEVEGDSPADIAPLFGLTANAVSALGYRAREGLRQAYLQEHLESGTGRWDRRHRETGQKLGAYTRGGLARREAERVESHLAECAECRALADELRDVNAGMVRSVVAPLVLGAGLVGYLASRGTTGPWTFQASTGELAVAGGGALGVLGALSGLTGITPRPAVPTPMRTAGVVTLAGAVGVAAFVLGDAVAPPAPPPVQAGPLLRPPAALPAVPPILPPGTLPPAAPPAGASAAPRSPAAPAPGRTADSERASPDAALALPGLFEDEPSSRSRTARPRTSRPTAAPAPTATRTPAPDRGDLALLARRADVARSGGDCLVTARLPVLDTEGVICRTGTASREASLDSPR